MTSARLLGPLWSIGPAVIAGITEESVKKMAEAGTKQWLAYLGDRLEEPTGYYQSNIHYDPIGAASASINDNNVIYGSWLEGIGSRNQTTSFKGYWARRDTIDYLEHHGDEIINEGIGRLIGMLR